MAIKIIKEGKKEDHATCLQCGCEFIYELEDVKYNSFVECPCCSQNIYHNGYQLTVSNPIKDSNLSFITINTVDNKNPCETCNWYKTMKGTTYIGDTPCTWCKHNSFTVSGITATSVSATKLD